MHAEHFSVWAIDFIGHGYSSKPDHPLEIKHYIDHVLKFMDAIGVEKVSLSGESLGGWVTAQFAHDHPEKVGRIVLNTMGGTMANPKVMERLYTLSMEAAKEPSWERVQARLEWLMADPAMVTDDLIRTRQAIFQQPDWLEACEANMALQDPETRKRNMITDATLEGITVPALVLWTTKDLPVPSTKPSGSPPTSPARSSRSWRTAGTGPSTRTQRRSTSCTSIFCSTAPERPWPHSPRSPHAPAGPRENQKETQMPVALCTMSHSPLMDETTPPKP